MDATHDRNKHKHSLFTLLSQDPVTGKGVPLAHLISSRKNLSSIAFWLYSLKAQLPGWTGPRSFMVDCDLAQIAAIKEQFPGSNVFLCWFHITRAWKGHDAQLTKDLPCGSTREEKSNALDVLRADLKKLLYAKEMDDAISEIEKFKGKYEILSKSFLKYFSEQWLSMSSGALHPGMWQAAYRKDIIPDNMNTTNMLESWHRKLKYGSFNGKPNRRRTS